MGFELSNFPEEVINQKKNISVKFTPIDLDLELITKFEISKSFDEAYQSSDEVIITGYPLRKWRVLNFYDLLESKKRAARPKDFLDIEQLMRNKEIDPN